MLWLIWLRQIHHNARVEGQLAQYDVISRRGRRVVRVTRSGLSISGLVFLHADSTCGEVKDMLNLRTIICYCAWWLTGGVLGLKQAYSADLLVQPA